MSYMNEAFYYEQKKIINHFHGNDDTLDLIVLPGISRTGTSVLFQCLYSTPKFLPRVPIVLLGNPSTEHNLWRIANWTVSKYFGIESLVPGSNNDDGMAGILIGEPKSKPLDEDIRQEMEDFIGMLKWQCPKVIKEPMCMYALQSWIDNYKCFKNAKYIWTRRDSLSQAKSFVRMKLSIEGTPYRGILTVKSAEKIGILHDRILSKIMPQVNHIEVWLPDLLNDTDNTFNRISEFVGARVNRDAFDIGKVYGKT